LSKKNNPHTNPSAQAQGNFPAASTKKIVSLLGAARWADAEKETRLATLRFPGHHFGWVALGIAQLNQGKVSEAVNALAKAVRLAPGDANTRNYYALALQNTGRTPEAEAEYRFALTLNPNFPEALANLGLLLVKAKKPAEAVVLLEKALEISPQNPANFNNLGTVYRDLERFRDAEQCFRRALSAKNDYFEAWINLGMTLADLTLWNEAQICYQRACELNPMSETALTLFGGLLTKLSMAEEALPILERLVALSPHSSDALVALGNCLIKLKQSERAWEIYRRARELRLLTTWSAKQDHPDFSVVLLDTPMAGSTPMDYLLSSANYERHFYCVLPGDAPHLDFVESKAEVVMNMIADADNGKDILPFALQVADALDRPIVNHPRKVLNTARDVISGQLSKIPHCLSPRTHRTTGAALLALEDGESLDGFKPPLLVRLAGTHGGDALDLFHDWGSIRSFVGEQREADFYVSDYIDYRSLDGFFRKYRLIYVDGEVFPYHLAIHTDWKVHYFRTGMGEHDWMRWEEEAFLANPVEVFGVRRWEALKAIALTTSLDYCGIDCGLYGDDEIVVFETNAAMLVHDEKEDKFTYKNVFIERIRYAFEQMLLKRALQWRNTKLSQLDQG